MNENKNNNFTPFVLGAVIGAAVAYLYSSEKGEKLRKNLIEEGTKILEKLTEGINQIEQEAEKGKKLVEAKIEPVYQEAKETVEQVITQVPEQLAQVQKKGRHFFFSKKPKPSES